MNFWVRPNTNGLRPPPFRWYCGGSPLHQIGVAGAFAPSRNVRPWGEGSAKGRPKHLERLLKELQNHFRGIFVAPKASPKFEKLYFSCENQVLGRKSKILIKTLVKTFILSGTYDENSLFWWKQNIFQDFSKIIEILKNYSLECKNGSFRENWWGIQNHLMALFVKILSLKCNKKIPIWGFQNHREGSTRYGAPYNISDTFWF